MASDEIKTVSNGASNDNLPTITEKKRKRKAEDHSEESKSKPAQTSTKSHDGPSKKKQKKGKNKSHKKQNQKQQDVQDTKKEEQRNHAVDDSIAMMDGRLLADHLAQKAQKLNKELTAVELDDLCVSGMRVFSLLLLGGPSADFDRIRVPGYHLF